MNNGVEIQLAAKCTKLEASGISKIGIIRQANDVLGARVNFDAEYASKRFDGKEAIILTYTGYKWSETCQTSAVDADAEAGRMLVLSRRCEGFSGNFVIGSRAYGCSGKAGRLSSTVSKYCNQLDSARWGEIKIGAEGMKNGLKAVGLCAEFGCQLYLLKNGNTAELLESAVDKGVRVAMWSNLRIAKSKEDALNGFLDMGGTGYLLRRGIGMNEIRGRAHEHITFGTMADVAEEIRDWTERGVKAMVFSIVFRDAEDYLAQLNELRSLRRVMGGGGIRGV